MEIARNNEVIDGQISVTNMIIQGKNPKRLLRELTTIKNIVGDDDEEQNDPSRLHGKYFKIIMLWIDSCEATRQDHGGECESCPHLTECKKVWDWICERTDAQNIAPESSMSYAIRYIFKKLRRNK